MKRLTNVELWNSLRKAYPNFANITSKGTSELFTKEGFEKIKNYPDTLTSFFELSLRVYLQAVNIPKAKDHLLDSGFGETYEQSRGGYVQRMALVPLNPVSPAFLNLENGKSIDPFLVRKPEAHERFFKQNFAFQNFITMPSEFHFKTIFISEYGMSDFMGGIIQSLEVSYAKQKYVNKLAAINAGLNSTDNPLLETQKIVAPLSTVPTEDELINFIIAIKDVITAMSVSPSTWAFNAMHYDSVQDISRLKLLVRAGFKNRLSVILARNSYNADTLNIPVDIVEVPDFGGTEPFKEASFTTPLYPVYDSNGAMIGYAESKGASEVSVERYDAFIKDPNINVNAILADKGWIFESIQNNSSLENIYNPRGMYTNYFYNVPPNTIAVDALYNVVTFVNS